MTSITNLTGSKERMGIYLPVALKKELEEVNKFLKKVQKGNKIVWFNNLPAPYSAGNELEARYFGYEILLRLVQQIITEYIPLEKQQEYLQQIPLTPILEAIKNMDIHLEQDRKKQLELQDLLAKFSIQ